MGKWAGSKLRKDYVKTVYRQPAYLTYMQGEVTQSCLTLGDPMDCRLPGSSVHGIFQAVVLEWIAISFSKGSSQPRDWTQVFHIVDRRFTIWATREVTRKYMRGTSCEMLAGWITSWNKNNQEKYQQPYICRWYHSNGPKWRGTGEPLYDSERVKWKSWLKT